MFSVRLRTVPKFRAEPYTVKGETRFFVKAADGSAEDMSAEDFIVKYKAHTEPGKAELEALGIEYVEQVPEP
jgi:hypothetical protein